MRWFLYVCIALAMEFSAVAGAAESSVSSVTKGPPSPLHWGLDIQATPVSFPRYQFSSGETFSNVGFGLGLAVEWLPFSHRYGKFGFGLGSGSYTVSHVTLSNGTVVEMRAFPVELHLSYRADFSPTQILVPFVKFGGSYAFVRESGIADARTASTYDGSLGLQVSLSAVERRSAHYLDRDHGINGTYLVAEWYFSEPTSPSSFPNLGRQEARVGFRFEM